MKRRIKLGVYHICKWLGLFSLASILTKRGLRILCYHGFELSDECGFRPKLFIKPGTFRKRMRYLRRKGYPVLPLKEACEFLGASRIPDRAVAITIDDGFYSVFSAAWPILCEISLPVTVYVTSYYAAKGNPIFRLAVQYVFWKTENRDIDLSGLGSSLPPVVSTVKDEEREAACWKIIRYGEGQCNESERFILMQELARRASVDFSTLCQKRFLSLMNAQEIGRLSRDGADIELHTHRHRLPEDEAAVRREISDNRNFLQPLSHRQLHHFCYPSGEWSPRHWPWLQALDVRSATTCDAGLNYKDTPLLGLKRFLDGENISQIEFEAELSGFSELLRRGRAMLLGA